MLETAYCNACGAPVHWVVSHKGRRFTVDVQPTIEGSFSLEGTLAKFIPPEFNPDTQNRYQAHKLTCSGKGKKAEKEALKRTLEKAMAGL
jgi:hypothetical protein